MSIRKIFKRSPHRTDWGRGETPIFSQQGEPMEKIHYIVTEQDDRTWETTDADIARLAFEKGSSVVEYKEYLTYSEHTVVRLTVSTELTSTEIL